jgi:alpha-D-ribose 1-methylphosphonate 5-triphosphate synthase subunit PhnL
MNSMRPLLEIDNVSKTFTLHLREGTRLDVVSNVSLRAHPGECLVLGGPSGAGKSSLLKMIYGNYRCDHGAIRVGGTDVASASPREIMALRKTVMGYVSQFLRVIPRVGSREIIAARGRESGLTAEVAQERAVALLARLNLPERLWDLPPATFSGGEQQRINIARGMIADLPVLLLDEPTASLDARNRAVVIEMIEAKKKAGCAIIGIFHDEDVRDAVATRVVDVSQFAAREVA